MIVGTCRISRSCSGSTATSPLIRSINCVFEPAVRLQGLSGITIECAIDECGDGKNLTPCCSRNLGDVFKFEDKEGGPLAKINCNCEGQGRGWETKLSRAGDF